MSDEKKNSNLAEDKETRRSSSSYKILSTSFLSMIAEAKSTQLARKIRCWIVTSILGYWTRRNTIHFNDNEKADSSREPPQPSPANIASFLSTVDNSASSTLNDSKSSSANVPDPPSNRSSIAPPVLFDDDAVRREQQQHQPAMPRSGLSADELPQHLAIIMDGNRRYGRQHWGNAWAGHWHGSRQLLQFTRWCLAEGIPEVTFFAFSTENWQRDAAEVAALMQLIIQHCRELQEEAVQLGIRVRVATTDSESLPVTVRDALCELQEQQQQLEQQQPRMLLNICLSYGSRGELVQACQRVVDDCRNGHLYCVTEEALTSRLLIHSPVDLLLRTSGERRLSNFLLWQSAYAELFFVDKKWPELQQDDLVDVLRRYARTRQRRFGK
jgi:undecaprenyl diphosphate synthase